MKLAEDLIAFALIGIVVWQVILPLAAGLKPWPLLRRRPTQAHLVHDIQDARQRLAEDDLRRELERLESLERDKSDPPPAA